MEEYYFYVAIYWVNYNNVILEKKILSHISSSSVLNITFSFVSRYIEYYANFWFFEPT